MSNALLPYGYYAADTHRRGNSGGRLFELYSPQGELLASYTAIALESVLTEMFAEINRREK